MTSPFTPQPPLTAWRRFTALALGLLALTAWHVAKAQVANPSFALIGHIERFTLDDPADPMSSARMRVRGIDVILPRHLLITMPGQYLTANDIFRGPNGGAVQAQSGLALADVPRPAVAFEAELAGNIVEGQYRAGIARISQGALHIGGGFIQDFVPGTGDMLVGALGGTQGARVRLNDPDGQYGPAPVPPLDRRFKLDPDNSPVHARTGFPVCVPGNATRCPPDNRPAGPLGNRFTCRGPVEAEGSAPVHGICDPNRPIPLRKGDYVSYVGALVPDGAGGFIVAAHGLEAEIGVYTSPRTEPVYVYVEMSLQGTLGEKFVDIPQEETTRVRVVGFTTDPTRQVEIALVDSDRVSTPLGTLNIQAPGPVSVMSGPAGLTPSGGPQLGRFRFTWPSKDNARAVRRDIMARVVGSTHGPTLTGLTSGLYVAPIGEYIWPEVTRFGTKGFPTPVAFENFCHLTKGGGIYKALDGGTLTIGPLSPPQFPHSGHPQSQTIGASTLQVCDGAN